MITDFTADLLDRPAAQAAGSIALTHLDAAAAAAARLEDPADHAALHDFRVAIRRLRVTIRAYPGVHEIVPKKQRRRLRKLARVTNAARDAEVQLEWFRTHSAAFTKGERTALAPLRSRLRARRRRESTRTQPELLKQFSKLERKLRRRLGSLENAGAHEAPFRGIAAAALVQHVNDLSSRLRALTPVSKTAEVHATRIAAKRLRYLLEPMAPAVAHAGTLVGRLKKLQDLLGALTDGHVLEAALANAGDGNAAAATVLRAEAAALFATLQKEWSQSGPDLVRQIAAVARTLRPVVQAPPSVRRPSRRRRRTTA